MAILACIGGWGYLSMQSVRHVPLFALVSAPVLARLLNEELQEGNWPIMRRLSERVTQVERATNGWAWIPVALAVMTLVAAVPEQRRAKPILKTDVVPTRFPVAAVTWIQEHPSSLQGEIFNEYPWGGYMMWAMPERKPFIDGRNDFYGATLLKEFNTVSHVEPGWEDVFNKYDVRLTILPRNHPLNSVLQWHPQWNAVYTDEVAMVFHRD